MRSTVVYSTSSSHWHTYSRSTVKLAVGIQLGTGVDVGAAVGTSLGAAVVGTALGAGTEGTGVGPYVGTLDGAIEGA